MITSLIDIVDTALATLSRRLPVHVARDDLASVGKIALVSAVGQRDAVQRKTALTDTDFRAWCYVRVRGAMLDELRRLDPLTRRLRDRANVIARARIELAEELGVEPTAAEIAGATGLTFAEINEVQTALAEAAAATGDFELGIVPDSAVPTPAESVEIADLHASLRDALARLPDNQALALRRYYLEDATLDDIAEELGVSRERARQVREAGEKKLRADLVVLSLWQTLISA